MMKMKLNKFCRKCKTKKDLTEFRPTRYLKNSTRNECRKCESLLSKNRYKNSTYICSVIDCDRAGIYNDNSLCAHHYKQIDENRFKNAIKSAKRRNKVWNISFNDWKNLIEKSCFYCFKLFKEEGSGLDRLDNNRGYELDNVIPCCGECNYLRSNKYTVEETKIMVDALLKFRGSNV